MPSVQYQYSSSLCLDGITEISNDPVWIRTSNLMIGRREHCQLCQNQGGNSVVQDLLPLISVEGTELCKVGKSDFP